MYYDVSVYFAHGVAHHFYRISEDDFDMIEQWVRRLSDPLLVYRYCKATYYMERDNYCTMSVRQSYVKEAP